MQAGNLHSLRKVANPITWPRPRKRIWPQDTPHLPMKLTQISSFLGNRLFGTQHAAFQPTEFDVSCNGSLSAGMLCRHASIAHTGHVCPMPFLCMQWQQQAWQPTWAKDIMIRGRFFHKGCWLASQLWWHWATWDLYSWQGHCKTGMHDT